jgi:hypothetical protein
MFRWALLPLSFLLIRQLARTRWRLPRLNSTCVIELSKVLSVIYFIFGRVQELLFEARLLDSIVVVAANKQEVDQAGIIAGPDELLETLDMDQPFDRSVAFVTCSGKTGAGVVEILSFLAAALPWDG